MSNEQDTAASRIPLEDARKVLATIWFSGSGVAFFLLAVQSILGRYAGVLQQVWSWFVPTIVPTLALMLGVIGATAMQDARDQRSVKIFFFKLSNALSIFYLVILLMTMLLEPFSALHGMDLYSVSNFWLGPLQSLVIAAVTVLFTSQEKRTKRGG